MEDSDSKLYLTDDQYKEILRKIEAVVSSPHFVVSCFDSVATGDKYTTSNCGFCNDDFTEPDTDLFPDRFPGRKTMKYRRSNHKCPFDTREEPGLLGWGYGCFSKCYLFKNRRKWDLEAIERMVRTQINSLPGG